MDWTLLWCLKDQADGHLSEFIGLVFYQKLSQDLVKVVIEIGDFFSINNSREEGLFFFLFLFKEQQETFFAASLRGSQRGNGE